MISAVSLCGAYLGLKKVREGCESELGPKDRRDLARAKPDVLLELRSDGTFKRLITEGRWKICGEKIIFTPHSFGGETQASMKQRTEEMGRTFTMAFVFLPFELNIVGDYLVAGDESSPIVTEFRRNW